VPDPLTLNLADAAIKLGALLVIYLCFIVAQRFLSRKQLFRGIELQLNLLVLVSLALLFLGPVLDQMHKYVWDAFKAAAVSGLVQLREAIEALRASEGDAWLEKFADFYMSVRRTCELGESCALQSLTPEVARADAGTKAVYEAELLRVVEAVAGGLPNGTLPARRKTAWAILSLLSGGVSIARSAADPRVGAQIAAGVKGAVLALTAHP